MMDVYIVHQLQAGIGTYTTPEIATPGMARISKTLDMAIAWNLDAHVMGSSRCFCTVLQT